MALDSPLTSFLIDATLDAAPKAAPRSKRRAARPRPEVLIRADVIAALIAMGGYAIPKHQTEYGVRGTPDVFACVAGRLVVVEIKTLGYDLQPDQRAELRKWQNAKALAGWVRSLAHLDELLSHLDDLAWRNDFSHPGDGRGASEPW
jgi:hypothetical protein